MVELRKRKAPAPPPAPATKRKSTPKAKGGAAAKVKEKIAEVKEKASAAVSNGATKKAAPAKAGAPAVGDAIDIDGFGGEIETNEGEKVTLKSLVDGSEGGVVLFTYPKASTPGCTNQVCLFRDSYEPLTSTGFKIYGLSADSPKANTTFKTKQNLPYPLLCDPKATLISAIGMKKAPSGTKRGVFVVDKSGKVLAAEQGSPAGTVEVVKKLVEGQGGSAEEMEVVEKELERKQTEDEEKADVAGEVADSAQKLDGES